MTTLLVLFLTIALIYCVLMYGIMAYRTFRYHEDYETETFHLGLCAILAAGFLLMASNQLGAVDRFMDKLDHLHPIQSSS